MIRIARSTFAMISHRYEHVARTLGCSEWRAFSQVTLPMAKSGLAAGIVITWSKAMGEFGAVLMLAGAEAGNPNWIIIVFGNIFVCAMEGLIVGIQVLRLEYYELFSRFYKGNGREFKPFLKHE